MQIIYRIHVKTVPNQDKLEDNNILKLARIKGTQ